MPSPQRPRAGSHPGVGRSRRRVLPVLRLPSGQGILAVSAAETLVSAAACERAVKAATARGSTGLRHGRLGISVMDLYLTIADVHGGSGQTSHGTEKLLDGRKMIHNEVRIQKGLGYKSPKQYRKRVV